MTSHCHSTDVINQLPQAIPVGTWLLSCSLNLGSGLLKYLTFGAVVLATSCTSHCAPLELSHHIFTLERANSLHHPTLNMEVSTSIDDYNALGSLLILGPNLATRCTGRSL